MLIEGNDDPYERTNDEYVDMALQRYISNDQLHKTTNNVPNGSNHNDSNGSNQTNYYDDQEIQR